ncbi:MAG: hypothetical protein LBS36_07975 [Oscillospiraceae bacterium]|nr:hypothetical protein [Oscillospiraceae bacterium]
MKQLLSLDGVWQLSYIKNADLQKMDVDCGSVGSLLAAGIATVPAAVPGNFERSLYEAGRIPDPFFGTNVWELQELEACHVFYHRRFDFHEAGAGERVLRFDGIDTVADIYLNGRLLGRTENMFLAYEFPLASFVREGENELVVHIRPACIESRRHALPVSCGALPYNYESLAVRKAAHSFGWDIMPRIVSCGIFKSAGIFEKAPDRIDDVFCHTLDVRVEKARARVGFFWQLTVSQDSLKEYSLQIAGECGGHRFSKTVRVPHTSCKTDFWLDECRLWWPRNAGEANVYDITVTLLYQDEPVDVFTTSMGIRTVRLERTSTITPENGGKFCFVINGRRVFCMGTNWVPLDAFHSNDPARLAPALEMVTDLGCNMVRCWGGNVYESEAFFDYCDRDGVMVWQDFAMGCGVYPRTREFLQAMETEATQIICRLRNHPSLVLWAGDNECDDADNWAHGMFADPNKNSITRELLPRLVALHDFTRPFLPSSPYIDEHAHESREPISENHLWGPRDYFKGDFYKNAPCCFASETGYHGCPSPGSLARFLSQEGLWPIVDEDNRVNEEWLAHASSMEPAQDAPYAYRIPLMINQAKTLFTAFPDNLEDFALQSQVSQAEAKKYFIERFRIAKWQKTGVLWWNLLDGWPQVSDAVVDYYFTKKLAYHYIRRSQQSVCFICSEPQNGTLTLFGVNDLTMAKEARYRVVNVTENLEVCAGSVLLSPESSEGVCEIKIKPGEKSMLLTEWVIDGVRAKNHYMTNAIGLDFAQYVKDIKKCGMLELEGFSKEF